MTRVVGLDLSLTGTGVTVINTALAGTSRHVEHARWETKPTPTDVRSRAGRLRGLAQRVIRACGGTDLVLVESPTYSGKSSTGSTHDRAGLWWLVCASLDAHGIPVVEVSTQHLKMYATGKGNGSKDATLAETVRRYGHLVPALATNDEADSLQLAAIGLHYLTGTPLVSLPKEHTRALTAIRWPDYVTGAPLHG